ncbi:hypothetical protein TNCV_1769631 [Trichonephila clavipes]|nr:hypothetical protein TNCV_1769631 [Trichonephila clavipes]
MSDVLKVKGDAQSCFNLIVSSYRLVAEQGSCTSNQSIFKVHLVRDRCTLNRPSPLFGVEPLKNSRVEGPVHVKSFETSTSSRWRGGEDRRGGSLLMYHSLNLFMAQNEGSGTNNPREALQHDFNITPSPLLFGVVWKFGRLGFHFQCFPHPLGDYIRTGGPCVAASINNPIIRIS